MQTFLAIDQGTHASRAILYDENGRRMAQATHVVAVHHIDEMTVEQDAQEILLSVRKVIAEVVEDQSDITAAGLATQRSTLVAWHRETGEVLAPAISWMDRRCAPLLEALDQHDDTVHKLTGLPLSPHYLAGKMRWLRDHNPRVQEAYKNQMLMLGPLSSYLCFHLLQGHPCVIDHSHALRSLLCDLRTLTWHPDLLDLFQIDKQVLPECVPTQHAFGLLDQYHIPLRSVCGDQNAALYSRGLFDKRHVIINLGSGAFMLHSCGHTAQIRQRLLSGVARSNHHHAEYLLEGTVNGAGAALSWLQEKNTDVDLIEALPGWLEQIASPPCFINAIGGLGSPWWRADLQSRFIPDTRKYAEQAVAAVESIVFLLQHNIFTLEEQGLEAIYISGGLSRLDGLCQRLADLSELTVIRYDDPEATARGAAWLASNREQPWPDSTLPETFYPQENPALFERYGIVTDVLVNELAVTIPWYNSIRMED